jgi:NitT/TauT family transport system substrate-binding protein
MNHRIGRGSFLTGATAAAASLATASRSSAATPPTLTVRVGSVPVDTYGQPYYGDAAGIFRDAGITIEVIDLANSGAIASAIAGGSLDVGVGSVSQVAGAREKGLPFTFFAPGALYATDAPGAMLMVQKDATLHSARDLIGKTIAVDNLTSFLQVGVVLWLKKNGVDPSQVKFIELPFSAMAGALAAARIDAATITEPALSGARSTARVLADTNAAIASAFFTSAWFTTESWIAANLPLAHRLAKAVEQTSTWSNAHHALTAVTLEKISKVAHETLASMTRARFGTKMDPALMDPLLDVAAKNGMIATPIAGRTLVYPGFAVT